MFKTKLLSLIHPPAKSVFGIHDPIGLSYLSQIGVGLSRLNCHKFKHNVRDTVNPICPTNDGIEDTEHFCYFALHLTFCDEILSLEFQIYYGYLPKSAAFQQRSDTALIVW